jgi:hypothetical protein
MCRYESFKEFQILQFLRLSSMFLPPVRGFGGIEKKVYGVDDLNEPLTPLAAAYACARGMIIIIFFTYSNERVIQMLIICVPLETLPPSPFCGFSRWL